MARRSLRAYSQVADKPVEMADKEEDDDLDDFDGQHIEENLGLDECNLNESPKTFFLNLNFLGWKQCIAVLSVLLLAVVLGCVFVIQNNETKDPLTEDNIIEFIVPMTKKFISQQKNTWYQILSGFTNIIRPPVSPAVYLLLSDEKSKNTSSCVAEIITSVANKILPSNKKWLFLNGTELSTAKTRDPGVLVESIAENMSYSKVVVVSDIQKIPGHLAAGFHFLVDQENPKIEDAVYVFTMTVDKIVGISKPLAAVEKTLKNSWSDLSENILDPLVTRVTEAVLHIVQEDEIGVCPLKTQATYEIKIP